MRIKRFRNSFAVSQDAECLATGDSKGTIKVFSMADFSLIYQSASQDPVSDLWFAPDPRRLYDVRSSHSNFQEPNALLRTIQVDRNERRQR